MFKTYTAKLLLRIIIFFSFLYVYISNPNIIENVFKNKLNIEMLYLYLLWLLFIVGMLLRIYPNTDKYLTVGSLKCHSKHYLPTNQQYTENEKISFIKSSNKGALITLISWTTLGAIIGILHYLGIIQNRFLMLLTMCFYVCDLICIVVWCPFQSLMMKNKCCKSCRIFNWDYAMMFTPLIFIRSIYSYSLVILSLIVAILWEISWYKHPERFWPRTNQNLQCRSCTEKLCKLKGVIGGNEANQNN